MFIFIGGKKEARGVSEIIGSGTLSINTLFEKLQCDPRIKGIASNPEQLQGYQLRDRPELFDLIPDGNVSCCANNPFLQDQPVKKDIHQRKKHRQQNKKLFAQKWQKW